MWGLSWAKHTFRARKYAPIQLAALSSRNFTHMSRNAAPTDIYSWLSGEMYFCQDELILLTFSGAPSLNVDQELYSIVMLSDMSYDYS